MQKTRAIIPCAGFGTRMNMKPNESKEMLWVESEHAMLIDYSLNMCKQYDLDPLIITRLEKQDLITYILDKYPDVKLITIEPNGEWPNTILQSKPDWNFHNILILPDTRFTPSTVLGDIQIKLILDKDYVVADHNVPDVSKWCKIHKQGYLIEKPLSTAPGKAMGLLAWRHHVGSDLFKALAIRNNPFKLENYASLPLDSFEDITREGTNLLFNALKYK